MLRRRSIRTKLVYALAVLTLIFSFLSFSGVWGVRRYRELADSVSQQADEIPLANGLVRDAQAIKRSCERLEKLREQSRSVGHAFRLIRADYLKDQLDHDASFENTVIEESLCQINATLNHYDTEFSTGDDPIRMLVDETLQQQSLWEIRNTKQAIEECMNNSDIETVHGYATFMALANKLAADTQDHLNLIHSEMREFSADVNGQYDRWILFNLVCMFVAISLVSLLWFSFKSLVAQPFRTLLDGSRLVAAGQYGHRIDLGTSDELNELAEAMNCMSTKFRDVYNRQKEMNAELDRQVRERTREVIQNEQLASVGFLAAGVAHEINNPLASIAWSAESLQSELDELTMAGSSFPSDSSSQYAETLQSNLQRIQDEAYRCKGITERLLDFSRLGDISRSSTDLCELVRSVVSIVSKLGKYKCKTLRMHCDDEVYAHVNSHEIQQVVLNLVTNALESVDSSGAVDVHVRNRGDTAYIGVCDDGCGMSQEVLNQLFEPFFTRRRDGTGTGLGLSISYRIVSQHHGSLTAASQGDGQGSQLELTLPVHAVTEDETEDSYSIVGWSSDEKSAA